MRFLWRNTLFFAAVYCAPQLSMAQRTAISPLAPKMPMVRPMVPATRGVDVAPSPAVQPVLPPQPEVTYWPAPQPDPLYVVNSQIVISNSFGDILPQDIKKLDIYKGVNAPEKWRSLTTYGIVDITLKAKSKARMKTRTLAEIGKWLQLSGPVSYSINGMPVGESDLRIAAAAIGEVKVTPATPTAPTTLVNITIVHHLPKPPAPDPSGKPRIMIRGMAAL